MPALPPLRMMRSLLLPLFLTCWGLLSVAFAQDIYPGEKLPLPVTAQPETNPTPNTKTLAPWQIAGLEATLRHEEEGVRKEGLELCANLQAQGYNLTPVADAWVQMLLDGKAPEQSEAWGDKGLKPWGNEFESLYPSRSVFIGFGCLPSTEAIPRLLQLALKLPSPTNPEEEALGDDAIELISAFGPDAASWTGELTEILCTHPSEDVRVQAAATLVTIGALAIPALEEVLLKTPKPGEWRPDYERNALIALGKLSGSSTRPGSLPILPSAEILTQIRKLKVETITKLGSLLKVPPNTSAKVGFRDDAAIILSRLGERAPLDSLLAHALSTTNSAIANEPAFFAPRLVDLLISKSETAAKTLVQWTEGGGLSKFVTTSLKDRESDVRALFTQWIIETEQGKDFNPKTILALSLLPALGDSALPLREKVTSIWLKYPNVGGSCLAAMGETICPHLIETTKSQPQRTDDVLEIFASIHPTDPKTTQWMVDQFASAPDKAIRQARLPELAMVGGGIVPPLLRLIAASTTPSPDIAAHALETLHECLKSTYADEPQLRSSREAIGRHRADAETALLPFLQTNADPNTSKQACEIVDWVGGEWSKKISGQLLRLATEKNNSPVLGDQHSEREEAAQGALRSIILDDLFPLRGAALTSLEMARILASKEDRQGSVAFMVERLGTPKDPNFGAFDALEVLVSEELGKTKGWTKVLLPFLLSDDPSIASLAEKVIKAGLPEYDVIRRWFKDANSGVLNHDTAIAFLAEISLERASQDPQAVQVLIDFLQQPLTISAENRYKGRYRAAISLSRILAETQSRYPEKQTIERVVLNLLEKEYGWPEGPVRDEAPPIVSLLLVCLRSVATLGGDGEKKLVQALTNGPDVESVTYALETMGWRDGKTASNILSMPGEANFPRRVGAVRLIAAMGGIGAEAVPALILALDEEQLREKATEALAAIGPEARPAMERLLQLAETEKELRKTIFERALPAMKLEGADLETVLTPWWGYWEDIGEADMWWPAIEKHFDSWVGVVAACLAPNTSLTSEDNLRAAISQHRLLALDPSVIAGYGLSRNKASQRTFEAWLQYYAADDPELLALLPFVDPSRPKDEMKLKPDEVPSVLKALRSSRDSHLARYLPQQHRDLRQRWLEAAVQALNALPNRLEQLPTLQDGFQTISEETNVHELAAKIDAIKRSSWWYRHRVKVLTSLAIFVGYFLIMAGLYRWSPATLVRWRSLFHSPDLPGRPKALDAWMEESLAARAADGGSEQGPEQPHGLLAHYLEQRIVAERLVYVERPVLRGEEVYPQLADVLRDLRSAVLGMKAHRGGTTTVAEFIGIGGSGKSSLVMQLGRVWLNDPRTPTSARNERWPAIPLLITGVDQVGQGESATLDVWGTLRREFHVWLATTDQAGSRNEAWLFHALLSQGRLIPVFDAVTEMPPAQREAVLAWIANCKAPLCLLTARQPLPIKNALVREYHPKLIDRDEVKSFVQRLLPGLKVKLGHEEQGEIEQGVVDLLDGSAIQSNLTPLFLRFACELELERTKQADSGSAVPQPGPRVLPVRSFAGLVHDFVTWPLNNHQGLAAYTKEARFRVLKALGSGMLDEYYKPRDLTMHQALDVVATTLGVETPEAEHVIQALRETSTLRTLGPEGHPMVSFMHDTVTEYLAAGRILDDCLESENYGWEHALQALEKVRQASGAADWTEWRGILTALAETLSNYLRSGARGRFDWALAKLRLWLGKLSVTLIHAEASPRPDLVTALDRLKAEGAITGLSALTAEQALDPKMRPTLLANAWVLLTQGDMPASLKEKLRHAVDGGSKLVEATGQTEEAVTKKLVATWKPVPKAAGLLDQSSEVLSPANRHNLELELNMQENKLIHESRPEDILRIQQRINDIKTLLGRR